MHAQHSLGKNPISSGTTIIEHFNHDLALSPRIERSSSTCNAKETSNASKDTSTSGVSALGSGLQSYADAKLLIAIFTAHIATTIPSSEVIVNNVCPGVVRTSLAQHMPWILRTFAQPVFFWVKDARTVEQGARCLVWAATTNEATHGKFIQGVDVSRGAELVWTEQGKEIGTRLVGEMEVELARWDKLYA
jgi:NAD(P)-dependent dehydrogenase (short-subunit alcohol dehydrogenase family)